MLLLQVRLPEGPIRELGLIGEAWLTLGMAFIAGMAWQRRGMAVVVIALSLTVLEALLVGSLGGFNWTLARMVDRGNPIDLQLYLRLPEISAQLSVSWRCLRSGFWGGAWPKGSLSRRSCRRKDRCGRNGLPMRQ